jgi:TonB family protein
MAASGFGNAVAAPLSAATPRAIPASVDRNLEILVKPRPQYTEEARRLQIEGEVVLEAEFPVAGPVRVLRVVQGLGHGLDESAAAAAANIRFRPAERHGQPMSTVARIRLVFQLAY